MKIKKMLCAFFTFLMTFGIFPSAAYARQKIGPVGINDCAGLLKDSEEKAVV
jgi:hypothetical protein